ncbi:MAG: hypothetical protein GX986_11015, partial [Firmicutes bacterium]|nr:hypothetical protein [Bacillota bacterium]
MPNQDEMMAVGQSCSEYSPIQRGPLASKPAPEDISCENCMHWQGEEDMCELDIYEEQLLNLDQT